MVFQFIQIIAVALVALGSLTAEAPPDDFDGFWAIVKENRDGQDDKLVNGRFFLRTERGVWTMLEKDGSVISERKFTIDKTKTPKEIVLYDVKGTKPWSVGVYEISGDTMKCALARDNGKQQKPVDFEPGAGRTIMSLRRQRAK